MTAITRRFSLFPNTTQRIAVQSYDEGTDTFTLAVTCSDEGRDTSANEYDYDDFTVPALVLPMLIGECGEPDELVGQEFPILMPIA